jgi:hypothetical protein
MDGATVSAKVRVESVGQHAGESGALVPLSLGPNYQDPANAAWASATPHLQLNMTVQGDVARHFEQGRNYTLHFVPED